VELYNPGGQPVRVERWRAVNFLAVNSAWPRLAVLLGAPPGGSGQGQALRGGLVLILLLAPALALWWREGSRPGSWLFWGTALAPLAALALGAGLGLAGLHLVLAWESLALLGLPGLALALARRPLAATLLGLAAVWGLLLATVLGVGLPPAWFGPPLVQQRHFIYMCGLTVLASAPLYWSLFRQRPAWFRPAEHPVAASLLWVFLPCLLFYLGNGYSVFGGDATYNGLLATRIMGGHGLVYDQAWVDAHGGFGLIEVGRGYLPTYPMGPGFFGLPTALMQLLLGGGPEHLLAAWNQKVTASWVAAAAAMVMFQLTYRLAGRIGLTAILTAGFALGTSQLGICSATLWQHGPVVLLLTLGLYCLLRGLQDQVTTEQEVGTALGPWAMDGPPGAQAPGRPGKTQVFARSRANQGAMDGFDCSNWLMLAALPLGFLPALRTQAVLFHLAGLVVVLVARRLALPGFLLCSLPGVAAFLALNLGLYGSLFGGYAYQAHAANFPTSVWQGLAGTLFSPNRGLLVFSPFLLLGLWAWARVARQDPALAWPWGLALAGFLAVHAKFDGWYAGWCNGARYSSEAVPVLLAFMAWHFRRPATRGLQWALAGLVGLSILINLPLHLQPGPIFQWNIFPNIDQWVLTRVWDYRDWQPAHFRYFLALEQGRAVPAFALVRNERLIPRPDAQLHYRVGVPLGESPVEAQRVTNLRLAAGRYAWRLEGLTLAPGQARADIVLDVINQQGRRLALPVPAGPRWEMVYEFRVERDGWVDLSLLLSGQGELELLTAQVARLGD
jgi:hypothetical protein